MSEQKYIYIYIIHIYYIYYIRIYIKFGYIIKLVTFIYIPEIVMFLD